MKNIMVTLNGSTVNFDSEDQKPIEYNNRTIVPIRKIFEEMGYTVEWTAGTGSDPKGTLTIIDKRNGTSETVIICKEGENYCSTRGIFYYYDVLYGMDYKNTVVGGRIMMPIRPVLESFGCEVDWHDDDNTSIVIIITPTANTYSVDYEYNGGEFITKRNIVNKGASVTLPSPTRDGYYFVGWYMGLVDGTCVGKGGSSYKPTASLTLYARWSNEYTVTYVANGGSVDNTSVTVKMGQSITLQTPNERQGYKFEGWYTSATDGNRIGVAGDTYTPDSNVTLYAQWSEVEIENKSLTMPQKYSNKGEKEGSWVQMYGCAVSSAINIAAYYNNRTYTLADVTGPNGIYNNGNTMYWNNLSYYNVSIKRYDNNKDDYDNIPADYLSFIKSEIDADHPVAIYSTGINPHTNNPSEHWVVAYKYINNAASNDDIFVIDSSNTKNSGIAEIRTLTQSWEFNYNKQVTGIISTSYLS